MGIKEDSYYLKNLLDPQQWFSVAGGLVEDSKELEPKVYKFWLTADKAMEAAKQSNNKDLRPIPSGRVLGTYYMLVAFAIENILKGIILKRDFEQLTEEARTHNKIPAVLKNHKLRDLAELANIAIDSKEEELLLRLTDNAIWRGRYPTPITENGLKNTSLYNGCFASQAYYQKGDISAINTLFEKLQQVA